MDAVTILLQLLLGQLIRKWPVLKAWPDRLIPIFNAILALIVQIVAALTSVAHAADSLAVTVLPQPVPHGHPGWWAVWHFVQPIILNTLLSSGIFSTQKNVVEHFKGK